MTATDALGCDKLVGTDRDPSTFDPVGFGPQLTDQCSLFTAPAAGQFGSSASAGGAVTATNVDEQLVRRRRAAREGESSEVGGASSADASAELGAGVNVFFSGQFEVLDRDETAFELGYNSHKWGFTAGADVQPTDWAVAGIAVNYNRQDGDFRSGGGFDTDSYGPIVFASFFPNKRWFTDLAFQFAHKSSNARNERAFLREDGEVFGGSISGAPDADEYEFNAVVGYDHPIEKFTVGPRVRVRYRHVDIDGYTEPGSTGLELRYQNDSIDSLQTALGIQASATFSTDFGVVVPQIAADWTREWKDDQRSIFAQFVQDNRPTPTTFAFQTNKTDRDFFHVGGGVVVVLPNGVQTFVNIEAVLGHDFLDNYGGSVGLRLNL